MRGHPPRRQTNQQTNKPTSRQTNGTSNTCHCCTCCKTVRCPVATLARYGRSERDFDAARSRGWWVFVSVVLLGVHWPSLVVVGGAYRMRGTTAVARLQLHDCALHAARCRRRREVGAASGIAAPDGRRAGSRPCVTRACVHALLSLRARVRPSISKPARPLRFVPFCVARLCVAVGCEYPRVLLRRRVLRRLALRPDSLPTLAHTALKEEAVLRVYRLKEY